jgi:glycosyltransferase involved in cell wall biosynthesis
MRIIYVGNDLAGKSKYHSAYATLKQRLLSEGFEVISTSSKKNQLLRLLDMIWTVLCQLKKTDYILIDVFSTSAFYYAYIISGLARIFNIKYIPILHGGDLPRRLDKSPKLSESVFKYSIRNVSPSKFLQSEFINRGYDAIVISNTIQIENFEFKERNEISPRLLYVRAFADIYNPILAIEVLYQLRKTYSDATLCMVGPDRDGTLAAVKNRIEELKLNNYVRITGVLQKEEWHNLSKKYDVFINTTNVDNTPVSLIEVMALGLPIVSTNVGGIPYLMSHRNDCILVKPENTEDMTNAICELLEDSSKTNLFSRNGRKKAETMDWEVVKHEWYKILV